MTAPPTRSRSRAIVDASMASPFSRSGSEVSARSPSGSLSRPTLCPSVREPQRLPAVRYGARMETHEELAERETESWEALLAEVQAVPPARREAEGVVPGWSVKDLVWHCAGWARFSADHLEAAADGTFADPFDGVPDEHWDRVSQEMIDDGRRMTFDEV